MDAPALSNLPSRVLMGPGPSDVPASVLSALSRPTIGHLDPAFLALMDEIRDLLREVAGTTARRTLPISGTGSAGMETCVVNLVEPGDRVLVALNGVFGTRLAEVARRAGAEVTAVEGEWGRPLDIAALRRAAQGRHYKVVCTVHAETSTGVLQPLEEVRPLVTELGALWLVDAVTSLGGVHVDMDTHGIDALYSGTQKCLSCPPGLSPVALSEQAGEALQRRSSPSQSWYLDLGLIGQYWGQERAYHHTAPINMLYGLHEALRLVHVETLPVRVDRHARNARALAAGLSAMGLELPIPAPYRLPPLSLVRIPDGVDDARVRGALLARYGLEIGGGLGAFKGRAWRIGLMGASSTPRHVLLCLAALAEVLRSEGHTCDAGSALAAASQELDAH